MIEKCPICQTKPKATQHYCLNCAWEFEYYVDELSDKEKERYINRLEIQKNIYNEKFILNKKITILKSEISTLLNEKNVLTAQLLEQENQQGNRGKYKVERVKEEKKQGFFSKFFKDKEEYVEIITIDGLMYQNHPFTKKYTWEEAKEYAKKLRLGKYDDWRLPTRAELNKLSNIQMYGEWDNSWKKWFEKNGHRRLKNSKGDEYFIRQEFVDNLNDYGWFWTSEERDSSYAWNVNFKDGFDDWRNKTRKNFALCVRG